MNKILYTLDEIVDKLCLAPIFMVIWFASIITMLVMPVVIWNEGGEL